MSVQSENNKVINLTIRCIDTDPTKWNMGEDLNLQVSQNLTIHDIALKIKELKGAIGLSVCVSRMMFYVVPSNTVIPSGKWSRDLRQNGIHNGSVLLLCPTVTSCFQWETTHYYHDKVVMQCVDLIDKVNGTKLKDLIDEVVIPWPMRGIDMKTFLRKYPEVFYIDTDTAGHGVRLVRINTDYTLPSWY